MKVIGTIQSGETLSRIEVDAVTYEEGVRQVKAGVPEGARLLAWHVERNDAAQERSRAES